MRTPTRSKTVAFDVPNSVSPERRRDSHSRTRDADEDRVRTAREADLSSGDGERKRRRRRGYRDDDTQSDTDVMPRRDQDVDRDRRRRSGRETDADPQRGGDSRDPRAPLQRHNTTGSVQSDSTVDLPPRFDEQGRKMPERGEDPFMDKINDIFAGRGTAGGLFRRLTGEFLGGGGGGSSGRDGEDAGDRRRSRRGR